MSRNLHQQYYKKYFGPESERIIDTRRHQPKQATLNWSDVKSADNALILAERNKRLTAPNLLGENPQSLATQKFELKVEYPGLITGIGINHEATIEGEFKLGMHFDWTYGMPVIYGSSVKGVLRSWFMESYKGDLDAGDLMMDIFSGVNQRDIEAEKNKYGDNWEKMVEDPEKRFYKFHKSIYDRDIFFDAVIVKPDKNGRILCSDSITPHGDNPLKNPTPITFMKIAPGCTLEFRFKLVNTEIQGKSLSAGRKLAIFKEILSTVGIGAKTNVGYGQLS